MSLHKRFGLSDASRFQKFFKDKHNRGIRKKTQGKMAQAFTLDFGSSLAERVETYIFFWDVSEKNCDSLVAECLYFVSRIERIGPILDVGVKVVKALNSKAGNSAVISFLRAYWGRLKLHFVNPLFEGSTESAAKARYDASACLEISMRLHFPPGYAFAFFWLYLQRHKRMLQEPPTYYK